MLAGDVIGSDLDDQDWVEQHRHPLHAWPAALPAGRPGSETRAAD
jgi:hypothetical protein